MQINVWGFDRGTRAAMTADLAVAVESAHLGKVLDPFLAAKALGDGQREYTQEELYALADAVGANRIIFGAAGHDYKGKMSITLLSQLRATHPARSQLNWSAPVASQTVENIVLDDDHPAVDNFAKAYPGMLKLLGITVNPTDGTPAQLELAHLPDSPLELVKNRTNSAQSAYTLLILGMLTPDHMEHVRECFAAKAFLITSTMSAESPEYKALRARAYMMLGYRVAALRVLATPNTLEEQELLAVLNGNLPSARALGPKETNPLKRLIDVLDENRIAADFGVITGSESTKCTYGDICETLYRVTGNDAYRREALDWAKVREKAEPWQAWSYAMEAALAPDSVERRRAIAMAWYLDPQSMHLSTLKKADIDAAVKECGALNMFLPKRGERADPAAI